MGKSEHISAEISELEADCNSLIRYILALIQSELLAIIHKNENKLMKNQL